MTPSPRPPRSNSPSLKNIALKAELLASSTLLNKLSKSLLELLLLHQLRGALAAAYTDGFALLFEQRTGKTWTALSVLKLKGAREVVLVGPKTNLKSTWERDFKKFCPEYAVFHDWKEYRQAQWRYGRDNGGRRMRAALLINYEALPGIIKTLGRRKWDAIIYDEAQRLKGRTSENSLIAAKLAKMTKFRLALTGTPLDKTPIDFFGIMRFVQPGLLGTTWKEFENEYVKPVNIDLSKAKGRLQFEKMKRIMIIKKSKPVFREDKREQFDSLVGPFCMRITQEDVGIERAVVHYIPVEMTGKQQVAYDEMESDMVLSLAKDTKLKAPLKVTQMIKLQQITGGFVMDEDKDIHFMGRAKLYAARALLDRLEVKDSGPIAIFCKFRHEIKILERECRMRSKRVAVIYGAIKDTKKNPARTNLLQAFQRGEIDYLICQQRTGGVGVDLYYSRKAIVYSSGHSFIDYEQMVSRLTFLHQEEAPEFFYIYVADTIDEDIVEAIQHKSKVSSFTLKRLSRKGLYHGKDRNQDRPQGENRKAGQGRAGNLQVRRRRPG